MATQETKQIDEIISSRRAMMMLGGTAIAGLALAGSAKAQATAAVTDADILNFALNLEYLEANFYYLAAFGTTIDKATTPIPTGAAGTGTGGAVIVKPNAMVPFDTSKVSTIVGSYATETAIEEGKHVVLLQKALGSAAVAQPPLDLLNSFNALSAAAGIGPAFDPFASPANFLIGAFVFEDVGVTAYHGAAPLITDKGILGTAAGILAVEAYHAGLIRTTINGLDPDDALGLKTITQKIAKFRAFLSGKALTQTTPVPDPNFSANDDIGVGTQQVELGGAAKVPALTILDADVNAIAFARTTAQVLSIVTGGGISTATTPAKGVFFPAGLNGTIK